MDEEKKDPLWLVGLSGGMFLVGRCFEGPITSPAGTWIDLKDPLMIFEVRNPQNPASMMFGMKPFLFAAPFPQLHVQPVILEEIAGPTLEILGPAYEKSLIAEKAQRAGIVAPDEPKLAAVPPTNLAASEIFRKPE